ncbi:MAG TPA: hypothetical protein V6D47_05480 [Oscillatoriaceae cyanobacterium]
MSGKHSSGFDKHLTDQARERLVGKGREADYPPDSDEGREFIGEMGLGGGSPSLRGYADDPKLDTPEKQRVQRRQ